MENVAINYAAVVVAAIVNFAIGALWYGPLFGKQWMGMMGFTPDSVKRMPLTPAKAMAFGFAGTIVTAFVLAHFAVVGGAMGVMGAFELAFWIWLGFMVPLTAGSVLWEGKPVNLFIFNIAYQLVAIFAAALVLVLWQ